jgi:hypothetical protein
LRLFSANAVLTVAGTAPDSNRYSLLIQFALWCD